MSAGVVLINPKYVHNVAAVIRACSCFDVPTLRWTGTRVDPAAYDRLPREERMKGYRDVDWMRMEKPLEGWRGATPVCVEISNGAVSLADFEHPWNAVYVFGPEDGGVPQVYRRLCHKFVYIPSKHCLNLAAAVNVVLYDRKAKRIQAGIEKSVCEVVELEGRGEVSVPGWDGK